LSDWGFGRLRRPNPQSLKKRKPPLHPLRGKWGAGAAAPGGTRDTLAKKLSEITRKDGEPTISIPCLGESGVQGRQPLTEREAPSQKSFSKIPSNDGGPTIQQSASLA